MFPAEMPSDGGLRRQIFADARFVLAFLFVILVNERKRMHPESDSGQARMTKN